MVVSHLGVLIYPGEKNPGVQTRAFGKRWACKYPTEAMGKLGFLEWASLGGADLRGVPPPSDGRRPRADSHVHCCAVESRISVTSGEWL